MRRAACGRHTGCTYILALLPLAKDNRLGFPSWVIIRALLLCAAADCCWGGAGAVHYSSKQALMQAAGMSIREQNRR